MGLLIFFVYEFRVLRTPVQDADQAESLVIVSRPDDGVKQDGIPIDHLGDEGDVGDSERNCQRIVRRHDSPRGMGVGLQP